MQFKVPQFIDIEDKIFGPFTFRQFVYLAGGGGLCFILYKLLGFFWGLIPMLIIAGFSLALTFYRPNNKPFINMLEASIRYAATDKLYIWKRRRKEKGEKAKEAASLASAIPAPKLGASRLRDLAWSLDVLDTKKDSQNEVE